MLPATAVKQSLSAHYWGSLLLSALFACTPCIAVPERNELDVESTRILRLEEIRATADALASAADDIPSALKDVRISQAVPRISASSQGA